MNSILNERWRCLALLPPTREVPSVGKCFALPGFHRLQPAIIPLQPHAGVIFPLEQRKTPSIRTKPRVLGDELIFSHTNKCRYPGDFILFHLHHSGPAAAIRAALTGVVDLVGHPHSFPALSHTVNGFVLLRGSDFALSGVSRTT